MRPGLSHCCSGSRKLRCSCTSGPTWPGAFQSARSFSCTACWRGRAHLVNTPFLHACTDDVQSLELPAHAVRDKPLKVSWRQKQDAVMLG